MIVKKVLHVIPSVGAERGGPSVMARTLTQALSRSGIETHVATTDDNGRERLDVPLSVPVIDGGVAYWYFRRQARFYTFSWPLHRWLAEHIGEYDVVHIHALFSFSTISAAYWSRRRGVPYIVRPLGTLNRWGRQNRRPWLKKLSFDLIESRVLRGASCIHYTSEQEREEAAELGINTRSEVIPNALPGRTSPSNRGLFRERHPQLRDRKIILFFSRIDPKKGLDLLLPAFALVRDKIPRTALVLAGSGTSEYVATLHHQAHQLGIGSDIIWAGFLSGEAKGNVLADADVFVLPSYSENFGIAAVEAMAAGLPVVVSDQVAIHREISASEAGIVMPCKTKELSEAILKILADPRLSASMGKNGQILAKQDYSIESVTAKVIELYKEVAR